MSCWSTGDNPAQGLPQEAADSSFPQPARGHGGDDGKGTEALGTQPGLPNPPGLCCGRSRDQTGTGVFGAAGHGRSLLAPDGSQPGLLLAGQTGGPVVVFQFQEARR